MDRIQQLQQAHPWLLEREASALLVAVYAAITNGLGLRGDALQEEMELCTKRMCDDSRENVEHFLKTLPKKLVNSGSPWKEN